MFWVIWTIRLSLACYFAALGLLVLKKPPLETPLKSYVVLWCIGCVLFWCHFAASFHFVHHWSHAEAVIHTTEQTLEYTGIHFSGGVYFNYAFAMVWTWDCLANVWFLRKQGKQQNRSRQACMLVHGYMLFMVVNGAIVFAPPATRWVSVVALLALAFVAAIATMLTRRPRNA